MDRIDLIKRLEKDIKKRTPPQIEDPRDIPYDKALLKGHYLLARLYSREGIFDKTKIHLASAEHHLILLNRRLDSQTFVGNTREKYLEGRKFCTWYKKIFKLEDELVGKR